MENDSVVLNVDLNISDAQENLDSINQRIEGIGATVAVVGASIVKALTATVKNLSTIETDLNTVAGQLQLISQEMSSLVIAQSQIQSGGWLEGLSATSDVCTVLETLNALTKGQVVLQIKNAAAWISETSAKVANTAATWAQVAATTAWSAISTTAAAVTTAFGAAWDSIVSVFKGIWDYMLAVVKAPINGIIGLINGLVEGVVGGINLVIKVLNNISFDVPDWVPVIGGETFGFNLTTLTAPKIPLLAKGAVLPANRPFLAVVGDQRHGTNVEAPLTTIQEAVAVVLSQQLRH